MTVKKLREALAKLEPGYDNIEIRVWMPGSYIKLNESLIVQQVPCVVLIEGNVVGTGPLG
jgi:hypothetical protein